LLKGDVLVIVFLKCGGFHTLFLGSNWA